MKLLSTLLLLACLLLPAPAEEKEAPTSAPEKSRVYINEKGILKGFRQSACELKSISLLEAFGKPLLCYAFVQKDEEGSQNGMYAVFAQPKAGKSWQTRELSITEAKPPANTSSAGYVYDRKEKQVFLLCRGEKEESFLVERSSMANRQPFCCATMKQGKPPGKPRDITREVSPYGSSSSSELSYLHPTGLNLRWGEFSGRLLFLATTDDDDLVSLYSDDGGKSWQFGQPFNIPLVRNRNPGFWDTFRYNIQLCEAQNGDIIAYCPYGTINPCLSSVNGGLTWEITTDSPETQYENMGGALLLIEPESRDEKGGKLIAAYMDENDKGESIINLTLSYDWGKTWEYTKQGNKATGVTALCTTAPGTIGMLCAEKFTNLPNLYTEFTLGWLTDGADTGTISSAPEEKDAAEDSAEDGERTAKKRRKPREKKPGARKKKS